MTRDQLVAAGVKAILDRYRPVPDADEQVGEAVGVVVDTVGPLIRAEYTDLEQARADQEYRAELLADLRAKVEALRDQWQAYLDADPTELERGRAWSRVDTLNGVLALLDGGAG